MEKAEQRVNTEPVSTASYCRLVLEEVIHRIYEYEYIEYPYNKELVNLMNNEELKRLIPFAHQNGIHLVRKTGNNAAHYGRKVNNKDALQSLKYLYGFLKWFAGTYSPEKMTLPGAFDESLVPKLGAEQRKLKEQQLENQKEQEALQAQIAQLLAEKEAILQQAKESEASLHAYKQEAEQAKELLQQQKDERRVKAPSEYTEAETRLHLIDANLKEAGWSELREGRELEYPVKGMPVTRDNPHGNGYADYVLWDDNGKPLAVIEAKRTSKDIEAGKHQAFLYANCLEQMHGQRPLIFFTNGYEIKLWNDTFYTTPRLCFGFYTKDELQWSIHQRNTRQDIRKAKINLNIAGRPYQTEAIQRVAESFVVDAPNGLMGNKREALLVMATGSGKTRTAAALVDVFIKHNWVKRVLFLADRNALVTQAKNSFGEHLKECTAIDLTKEKEKDTTRLVFSTYPTMMNCIDNARQGDERFYGVGHFDMIIVDEAHRSVYNRYQAIFDYFDALIVGLTATPKDSIDHNTFELFACSNDDPTFSYELDEAVPTYLKPYKNIDVSTDFMREGIKYSELTEDEKAQYEETFQDKATGLFPEEIQANAMNKWLFNKDTVNKVLDTLMQHGLKIEGGDKIGRTIIFAVNQKHAKFIEDCFTERYPHLPAGFISTVHNKVSHAQSLIEAFCDQHKENLPQIAVSVDMMDTGIDAPRVLNLIFFKVVRSYAKFWQMIGRGTRLCPDVFGPGEDKEHFLIFDVCQNFEFFELNKKGVDTNLAKPITQQIFEARLQVSRLLAETGEMENVELATSLLNTLHQSIVTLNRERFQVKMNLRYVEEFEERKRWNNLSADDVHQIEEYLSALPIPESINETARRFDLMMLKLQLANLLMLNSEKGYHENLVEIANQLSKVYTVPQVLRSKPLIEQMKDPDFYQKLSQKRMEEIREEIRELVCYIDRKKQTSFYTNLEDSEVILGAAEPYVPSHNRSIYKERVERFIRENKHQLTITKLSGNIPITNDELSLLEKILFDGQERGSKEDFATVFGEQPLGTFIRSIIGLDSAAAQDAFSEFLQVGKLQADQMTFIQNIITYLTKNGTIDKRMLFQPPFTDMNDQGLFGVFDDAEAGRIIHIIDEINENAVVG
ncbi:DEAD/DEAH box helicase family protein [Carboxylicivirga marina]|uniref:DEAD/DEAH box helicase family protein n=1 Tax=Carboxylicivirga marina TaxID=2800988 RepID=A0ABS1HJZ9_9BACT|nr:DEAD/DEAH box helicase family protein [Carboxylicivirga marina]MBK3517603.1 DEAD/DEAH box helicase family protein [Carboxylicivirga marina]